MFQGNGNYVLCLLSDKRKGILYYANAKNYFKAQYKACWGHLTLIADDLTEVRKGMMKCSL